jgi:hypothetical protein
MRSNQLSYTPAFENGGGKRDRTDDLLNANQALSQLSYTPGDGLLSCRTTHKLTSLQKWCGLLAKNFLSKSFLQLRPEGRYPRSNLAIGLLLRKEVIQPLVPQRLPCYDFILVTGHTFDAFLL